MPVDDTGVGIAGAQNTFSAQGGQVARADLTLFRFGGPVQAEIHVAMQVQKGLQHIQHLGHLGEDKRLVAPCLELMQQHCQLLHDVRISSAHTISMLLLVGCCAYLIRIAIARLS